MSEYHGVTRRRFIKQSGAAFVAASVLPTFIPQSAFGANDRINLAVIGIRGQGGSHIGGFGKLENVRLHTICDVDRNLFAARQKEIQEKFGYVPKTASDMRQVFGDKEIDAVTFATPNHWHALGTIWAVQAGKAVYVEKPASWSIWEGRQMVNAARQHGVLVQVGFQNRSRINTRAAIKLLHEGGIGKVYMARGLCFKPRADIGTWPDGPMKADEQWGMTIGARPEKPYTAEYLAQVDYDQWMGPARVRPFNRNRFHYNWHWQWEYGNGDTGNQGPHQLDVGRWGLNKDEYPVRVTSHGGMFAFKSDQNTPNTQTTVFEYADGTIFEFGTRGLPTNREGNIDIGDIFYGSEGRLEIDAEGNWKTFMGHKGEPGPDSSNLKVEASDARITVGTGSDGHYSNFIAAVRSGKKEDLTCDVEVGHRSTVLAHLGNIALRVGHELKFDGNTERFVDNAEANKLLKRENYRAPYVVPDLGRKA